MSTYDDIKTVMNTFIRTGLIENDTEKCLSCVSEETIGFGMGEQGFVSSKEEMFSLIHSGAKKDPDTRYEYDVEDVAIRIHHEVTASLCAKVVIRKICAGETTFSGLLQSLTLKKEKGAWLICALHASPIILSAESIDAYPLKFIDNTVAHLKAELQTETFDLMNKAFSGGILGCYITEGRFPLYFINDSMLEYLGFTREAFEQKYSYDVFALVHPDDKRPMLEMLREVLRTGSDYEFRYRVQKKNGEAIWMLWKGRKATDGEGNAVLITILVDITEMIELQNEFREQTNALAVSEQRFRIAFEKSCNIIFDYDIRSETILHPGILRNIPEQRTDLVTADTTLIPGSTVMDTSLEEFWKSFERIRNGEMQVECMVRARTDRGEETWNRIVMTGIVDRDGLPMRAIGFIEDMSKQKEAEIAYAREEQFRQAIFSDALASYVINFTRGEFESCTLNSSLCRYTRSGEPYDAFIVTLCNEQLGEEERRRFIALFSRVNAVSVFERGQTELEFEYLVFHLNGTKTWMRTILRLFIDVETDDLKGFLYVTDIDKKKRAELEWKYKSEHDPLTSLYNKITAENRIRDRLSKPEELQTGVFMILDLDNFKGINDTCGHPVGDMVLTQTAQVIRDSFRETDIFGRIGGDEFCIFFSGMRSLARIEQAASELCKNIRRISASGEQTIHASCSIGIALCGGQGKHFEQLYKEADQALYAAKSSGRDQYAFF